MESLTNVGVGYILAVLTQLAVFPMVGLRATLGDSLILGLIFTAISIIRSYVIRRLFERMKVRARQTQTAAHRGAAAMRTSEVD